MSASLSCRSCRISVLVLLLSTACGGSGGSQPSKGQHEMIMVSLEQLRGVSRLHPGMQKPLVIQELGLPSSETVMMGKRSRESSGVELSYYVYRESPTLVNEKKDKWLSLYFDRSGGLVSAYTTIAELDLDPRLRMRVPSPPDTEPPGR